MSDKLSKGGWRGEKIQEALRAEGGKMREGGGAGTARPFVNSQRCDLGDRWGRQPITQ